jgi:transcriptional regulator with XRE-family HTH domain
MNRTHYDYEKLADIRRKIGTQEQVAEKIGITATQLSRAENGKSASYELLSAITRLADADVLDVLKSTQKNLATI